MELGKLKLLYSMSCLGIQKKNFIVINIKQIKVDKFQKKKEKLINRTFWFMFKTGVN